MEPYLFHSLEVAQSLVENRPGGETGVREIVAWQDDAVWDAMARGKFFPDLLVAAGGSVPPSGSATQTRS